MCDADKSGFFANAYVCGNKALMAQSIPGVESSPLTIGAPMPFLLHDVPSLCAMPNECTLATHHLRQAGCKVRIGIWGTAERIHQLNSHSVRRTFATARS